MSGEHDTAGKNLALVFRRDHYLAVVFSECMVLNPLIYMNQVSVVSFIWLKLVHKLRNILYWGGGFIRLISS